VIGVEASVTAKWIFTEEHSDQARALLRTALSVPELIVAPPLLRIEVTKIIRQRMCQEGLPLPEAQQRLAAFLAIP
jgi:predicted nucleic acid-binding protein